MNQEITILRPVINKNFLIRVTFITKISEEDLQKIELGEIKPPKNERILVGAGQYHKYVGEEICLKHFNKVLANGLDQYTFRMRRGLKIEFVGK